MARQLQRQRGRSTRTRTEIVLTFARLVVAVAVRLVSGHALASAGQQAPCAVSLAEVGGRLLDGSVADADAVLLDDARAIGPGGRVREHGEVQDDARAHDVVDAHGDDGRAGALVAYREVDAAPGDGDVSRLRVDDRLVDVRERLVGGYDVNVRVRVRVPGRALGVREVALRLVVLQLERLLALLESLRVRILDAATHRELDLDVQAIGAIPVYVRQPEPVVAL